MCLHYIDVCILLIVAPVYANTTHCGFLLVVIDDLHMHK